MALSTLSTLPSTLALFNNINGFEWIVILLVLLVLFGRRLPEVGKSLGKGIVEFKRGLKGVEDDLEAESNRPAPAPRQLPQNIEQPPAPGQPGTVSRADTATN